jgi:hypothetical protein
MKNSKGKTYYLCTPTAHKYVFNAEKWKRGDEADLMGGYKWADGIYGRVSLRQSKTKKGEFEVYFREAGPGKMPETIIVCGSLDEVLKATNEQFGLENAVGPEYQFIY